MGSSPSPPCPDPQVHLGLGEGSTLLMLSFMRCINGASDLVDHSEELWPL
jgi:hypothetical protein